MGAMDSNLSFDYHSSRAQKARIGSALRGVPVRLLRVSALFSVVGGILLLLVGISIGWMLLGISVLCWMIVKWYDGELHPGGIIGPLFFNMLEELFHV